MTVAPAQSVPSFKTDYVFLFFAYTALDDHQLFCSRSLAPPLFGSSSKQLYSTHDTLQGAIVWRKLWISFRRKGVIVFRNAPVSQLLLSLFQRTGAEFIRRFILKAFLFLYNRPHSCQECMGSAFTKNLGFFRECGPWPLPTTIGMCKFRKGSTLRVSVLTVKRFSLVHKLLTAYVLPRVLNPRRAAVKLQYWHLVTVRWTWMALQSFSFIALSLPPKGDHRKGHTSTITRHL